jgi:hypothetical protein
MSDTELLDWLQKYAADRGHFVEISLSGTALGKWVDRPYNLRDKIKLLIDYVDKYEHAQFELDENEFDTFKNP